MTPSPLGTHLIEQEARALLTRLDQVRPFALTETMVLAASLPFAAHAAIERFLHAGRGHLRREVGGYLRWLRGAGRLAPVEEQQRRFVVIRMRFNDVLSQFDLFAEVITQRSEHETGVWLSGLDVLARDAVRISPAVPDPPPMVCYLARGPGAAIRRARTRLPGGDANPVAIIRVPRERMIGHGIGSSLVHETGHQGAALLDIVESLKPTLAQRAAQGGVDGPVWATFAGWSSEIVADCWSVGTLGIASTLGLLAVVSLPTYFVFRPSGNDPHPTPYLRLLISAAIGQALYPHRQWSALAATWKALYPAAGLSPVQQRELVILERAIPAFVQVLLDHRPPALRGRPIRALFPTSARQPSQLLDLHRAWGNDIGVLARQQPTLVFAVIGQARAAGLLTPEHERHVLAAVLRVWALRSSLDAIDPVPPSTRSSVRTN